MLRGFMCWSIAWSLLGWPLSGSANSTFYYPLLIQSGGAVVQGLSVCTIAYSCVWCWAGPRPDEGSQADTVLQVLGPGAPRSVASHGLGLAWVFRRPGNGCCGRVPRSNHDQRVRNARRSQRTGALADCDVGDDARRCGRVRPAHLWARIQAIRSQRGGMAQFSVPHISYRRNLWGAGSIICVLTRAARARTFPLLASPCQGAADD